MTDRDLLQRLAFKSADFGGLGHISFASGKKIVDIVGIKRLQGLLFGFLIGQLLKRTVHKTGNLDFFSETDITGQDFIAGRKQYALHNEVFYSPDIALPGPVYKNIKRLGGYFLVGFV